MMSSEEFEVLYTVRSELAKKGVSPGVFNAPGRFGPGGCGGPGPWGFRPWGFGGPGPFGPWGYGVPEALVPDVVVTLEAGCACCHDAPLECSLNLCSVPEFWVAFCASRKDATPAEMGVLVKYREKGRQRAAIGGMNPWGVGDGSYLESGCARKCGGDRRNDR